LDDVVVAVNTTLDDANTTKENGGSSSSNRIETSGSDERQQCIILQCCVCCVGGGTEIFQAEPFSKISSTRILKVEGIPEFQRLSVTAVVTRGHEGEGKPSRHYHPSFHCTTIIIFNDDGGILHHSIIINFVDLSSVK
jgi:hypothetical protein